MPAHWGQENAAALPVPENPDLVVIGFGMNNGTFKVEPALFVDQIKDIMQAVKTSNPS
ncbi:MAG: SGNH/GDSL hydrolase family protein [Chitinophagaceae bacterium]|nr:SGNH/GDSL hydrolase family protein [Chitinophagaceae bacterium]